MTEVSQNFITFPDKVHVLTGVGAGEGEIIPYLDLQQPADRFSARSSFSNEPADLMPPIPDVALPTLETFRFQDRDNYENETFCNARECTSVILAGKVDSRLHSATAYGF